MQQALILAWILLAAFVACATAIGESGTYVSISGENQYRLLYPPPGPEDQQPIQRYDHSPPLTTASGHDVGQTLKITFQGVEYVVVMATMLQSLRIDNVTQNLSHVSSMAYEDGFHPKRLMASTKSLPFFYLEYEDHLFVKFSLFEGVIRKVSSGVDTLSAISTVAHCCTAEFCDDIYVWAEDRNTLVFHSAVGTIRVPDDNFCDDITAVSSQPPITQNGKFSFTMLCTKDSTTTHYHVATSFDSPESLLEVHLIVDGTTIASSSYLIVYNGTVATVYNRHELSNGVPRLYTALTEIQQVMVFETGNITHFLLGLADNNLRMINAKQFLRDPAQGVSEVPDTLQGSVDVRLPYAVLNDGILVTAKKGALYDLVSLTGDELAEVARVENIPELPAFVTFIADPIPPTVTTPSEATTTKVSETPEELTPSIVSDEDSTSPTVSTEGPNAPARSVDVGQVVGGTVGGVFGLIVVVAAVIMIIGCFVCKRGNYLPRQEKQLGTSEMTCKPDPIVPVTVSGPPQLPQTGAIPHVVIDVDSKLIDEETGEGPTQLALDKRRTASENSLQVSIEAISDQGIGDSLRSSNASSAQSSRSATPAFFDRLSVNTEQVC